LAFAALELFQMHLGGDHFEGQLRLFPQPRGEVNIISITLGPID